MQSRLPSVSQAKELCKKLCDTAKDAATKADLRAKMAALDKDLNDTVKKLGRHIVFNFGRIKTLIYTFYNTTSFMFSCMSGIVNCDR